MNRRDRPAWFARKSALAPLVLAGLVAGLAFTATAPAQPQAVKTPECIGVVKGAPWSYKGQKGTAYTVLVVNGASCATALKFVPRWTRERGSGLTPVPAGWRCSAIGSHGGLSKLGQCTTPKGSIVEWLPQLKK